MKIEKARKIQWAYRRMRWIVGFKKFMANVKLIKKRMVIWIQSLRLRKYAQHAVKIQRFLRYKILVRKLRDTKSSAKLVQTYIKRYVYIKSQ